MAENPQENPDDIEREDVQSAAEEKAPGGKKKILILLVLFLLLGGGGGAAWFVFGQSAEDTAEDAGETKVTVGAKPHYLQLDPGFVVNLNDPDLMRYLQVDVQLMSHKEATISKVEEIMPEVRNRLLLLLAQQTYEELIPRAGKEKLQEAVKTDINNLMASHGMAESISAVYFTSFVMQ